MRYLFLLLVIGCQPNIPKILPPNDDMATYLCQRGLECSLLSNDPMNSCKWCVNCFFDLNGGQKKWEQAISEHSSKCKDVQWVGDYAGIFQCINQYQPGDVCKGEKK